MTLTLFFWLALTSGLLLFPTTWLLRRFGVVDVPNERSSHIKPVVRGGGVTMLLVLELSLSASPALRGFALPVLTLAAISFIDDMRSVGARWRFTVQLATAGAAIGYAFADRPIHNYYDVCIVAVALLGVVGYANAFNFMDGINGLAAGQAVIAGLGTALLTWRSGLPLTHPGVILAMTASAVALGFWPHNFPFARVFMGDVGSASLGFILALAVVLIALDTNRWAIFALCAMHANFTLDTSITLVRRIVLGKRWTQAHREHFYQLLVRSGCSHTQVTMTEMGLQCAILAALFSTLASPHWIQVLTLSVVLSTWLLFFRFAYLRFRKSSEAFIS